MGQRCVSDVSGCGSDDSLSYRPRWMDSPDELEQTLTAHPPTCKKVRSKWVPSAPPDTSFSRSPVRPSRDLCVSGLRVRPHAANKKKMSIHPAAFASVGTAAASHPTAKGINTVNLNENEAEGKSPYRYFPGYVELATGTEVREGCLPRSDPGARTSARSQKLGRFDEKSEKTVFLDFPGFSIGSLPRAACGPGRRRNLDSVCTPRRPGCRLTWLPRCRSPLLRVPPSHVAFCGGS